MHRHHHRHYADTSSRGLQRSIKRMAKQLDKKRAKAVKAGKGDRLYYVRLDALHPGSALLKREILSLAERIVKAYGPTFAAAPMRDLVRLDTLCVVHHELFGYDTFMHRVSLMAVSQDGVNFAAISGWTDDWRSNRAPEINGRSLNTTTGYMGADLVSQHQRVSIPGVGGKYWMRRVWWQDLPMALSGYDGWDAAGGRRRAEKLDQDLLGSFVIEHPCYSGPMRGKPQWGPHDKHDPTPAPPAVMIAA